ncbi:Methylmalonic aciduria type A protein, mitochondrial [Armadillidium vulgare]|nr:Methylmalonic aciduria type A protein, mitochondrial [Armadillidium vulgare]
MNTKVDPLVKNLLQGVVEGRRAALAESITLVESSNARKKLKAKELIYLILQYMKNKNVLKTNLSFRIGLSGPPGAGKSTFIESFGKFLTSSNLKVAVLAVDPSSATTGGSILGDKTRMPELSKDENAFIRPSPSRGYLGGVTRSTNEAILLCEASGYDVIIVETVGVGQSEYSVADMVDLFALLIPPGSGDELQGIKRGIMELSDIVIVNKSDGDLINAAMRVQYEYISALKYMPQKCLYWKPVVKRVSSVTGEGIKELWEIMINFKEKIITKGEFKRKREHQQKAWMWTHIQDNVANTFLKIPAIQEAIKVCESQVIGEVITPGQAADIILLKIIEEVGKMGK